MNSAVELELLQSLAQHCAVVCTSAKAQTSLRHAAVMVETVLNARAEKLKRGLPVGVFAWPEKLDCDEAALCEVLAGLVAHLRIYRQPRTPLEECAAEYQRVLEARLDFVPGDAR